MPRPRHTAKPARRAAPIAAAVAAFVVVALAGPAAPARAADGDPAPSDATLEAAARVLYDSGKAHHLAGRYADALAAYRKAYEIYPSPLLRFNMAQVTRLLGRDADALALYRAYLAEKPDAPNRALVLDLIAELEKKTAPAPASPRAAPATPSAAGGATAPLVSAASPGAAVPPAATAVPPAAAPGAGAAPARKSRLPLVVALTAGAVVLVAGATVAVVAIARHRPPPELGVIAF